MTSVTLSSTSGQLNGGFPTVTDETSNGKADFDASRTNKRPLASSSASSGESCKKRRKQSTPIRISTTDSEPSLDVIEGKPAVTSPEANFRCSICLFQFDSVEQLRSHIMCDHQPVECKKEPGEYQAQSSCIRYMESPEASMVPALRPDLQWLNEIQNLPFNATNPMFMSFPQFAQSEKRNRIFNPDAYCYHCSKEFCNKYFLKTHKANKHGIYGDTPSSEPPPQASSVGKLSNPIPGLEVPATKQEPKTPVYVLNPFNNMFSNSAQNQMIVNLVENKSNESATITNGQSSSSGSDKVFPDDQPTEELSSPSNTQHESTSIKTECKGSFLDTSTKLPVEQQSHELDLSYRLRMRMGVVSTKAFCEICCKEYCNKYFLRTHKLKRHGIYTADEKEKDSGMEEPNASMVQTSPLNLIMTEQTSSDCKTTSPSNISCDICNIKFPNASLAHLHNVTAHSKFGSKEEDNERSVQSARKQEISKPNEKALNSDAISEDLQKLQTMISQLNEIDTNKGTVTCKFCSKEFENHLHLPAHMMSEHGTMLEVRDLEKTAEVENTSNNNTLCDICGKEVQSADEMTKHIMEFHSNNQISADTSREDFGGYNCGEKLSGRLSMTPSHVVERRVSTNVTPTSSYCEICNKELCNKYFMKTHMQRMHGIEIENGAQIGGVVCDICNKELCSKYFLRVHKHNTHGIIEYGSNLLPPRKTESDVLALQPPPPTEPDPALKPGDLADMSHRYFTHFTEVCTICSRRFRSTKWLKAHLITDHGQAGAEKWTEIEQQLQQTRSNTKSSTSIKAERTSPGIRVPSGNQDQKLGIQNFISSLFGADDSGTKIYQCTFCPFTTPLLPLIFVHERSHSMNMDDTKPAVVPQNYTEREFSHPQILSPMMLPTMIKEEDTSKDNTDEQNNDNERIEQAKKVKKQTSSPISLKHVDLSPELGQSLKDVAMKTQWPATYAIPHEPNQVGERDQEDSSLASKRGYVMQAFLLEESTNERRVMPSVVFLPMIQKQPSPITVTFTLTPA